MKHHGYVLWDTLLECLVTSDGDHSPVQFHLPLDLADALILAEKENARDKSDNRYIVVKAKLVVKDLTPVGPTKPKEVNLIHQRIVDGLNEIGVDASLAEDYDENGVLIYFGSLAVMYDFGISWIPASACRTPCYCHLDESDPRIVDQLARLSKAYEAGELHRNTLQAEENVGYEVLRAAGLY